MDHSDPGKSQGGLHALQGVADVFLGYPSKDLIAPLDLLDFDCGYVARADAEVGILDQIGAASDLGLLILEPDLCSELLRF